MRSQEEMLNLILDTAKGDEGIRAVMMSGSRANRNVPPDIFQDFDIIYFVNQVQPYQSNLTWISQFGPLMILQMPDEMGEASTETKVSFAYLMQFEDGNRLDLTILPLEHLAEYQRDSLSILLLDKDGIFPKFPAADESAYIPTPPTAKQYADCCNEFWWVCPYLAKGLWRKEILYAKSVQEQYIRPQLMKMLTWKIGMETEFSKNPGKFGKYFERYLSPDDWRLLLKTYSDGDYENSWQTLFTMMQLFRTTAREVSRFCGFIYPSREDRNVTAFLYHIHTLPKEAKEIY